MAEREKAIKNKADSLKRFLSDALCGSKFQTPRNNISWRKSESVSISDPDKIPDTYFQYEPKILKDEIKKALKSGVCITGAELISNNNIQIK